MSQCQAILDRLKQTPGEWVPMPELCRVSGSLNVHSRKSDLVKMGYTIENDVRTVNGQKISRYRLVAGDAHSPVNQPPPSPPDTGCSDPARPVPTPATASPAARPDDAFFSEAEMSGKVEGAGTW